MGCPACFADEVRLSSVVKGEETHILLYCPDCRSYFPLNSKIICPNFEAFCELITDEVRPVPDDVLTVSSRCTGTGYSNCDDYLSEKCRRMKFIEDFFYNNHAKISMESSVIEFN